MLRLIINFGSNMLKTAFRNEDVIDAKIAELGDSFDHVKTYVN